MNSVSTTLPPCAIKVSELNVCNFLFHLKNDHFHGSLLTDGRLTLQVAVGVCLGFTFCFKLSTCEVRSWINANIRPQFTLLLSSVVVTCDCHWMDSKVSFGISSEDMGTQPWPLPFKLILVHKLIPTRRYWWPTTRSSLHGWRGNRKAQTTTTSELASVCVCMWRTWTCVFIL